MSASSRAKAANFGLMVRSQFHVEMRIALSSVLILHCLACGGNGVADTAR